MAYRLSDHLPLERNIRYESLRGFKSVRTFLDSRIDLTMTVQGRRRSPHKLEFSYTGYTVVAV